MNASEELSLIVEALATAVVRHFHELEAKTDTATALAIAKGAFDSMVASDEIRLPAPHEQVAERERLATPPPTEPDPDGAWAGGA